jgi:hypothetical protein
VLNGLGLRFLGARFFDFAGLGIGNGAGRLQVTSVIRIKQLLPKAG